MADEDDLYADLYAEDAGGDSKKVEDDGEDLLADDGGPTAGASGSTAQSSAAKSSFIPPAPAQSAATGGSFIPPASKSSTATSTFIPPVAPQPQQQQQQQQSYYTQPPRAQIETAPMTNTDNNRSNIVSSLGQSSIANRPVLPHEMPDEGKLFVGGLNWDTTDEGLKNYFSQFGKVNHCLIMRDPSSGRSRGFAFLTFDDPKSVNSVMVKEHFLDGKMIDPKRAIPRADNAKTAKCFVGGIPQSATSESFKAYFQQFGPLLDSTLMLDRETQKPRGYGFVTYETDEVVERLLQMGSLSMDGKLIEVKRATPRNADGTRRAANPRNENQRFGGGYGNDSNYNAMGGGGSVGGGGGGMGGMSNMGDMSSMMAGNPMAAMMMNPMFAGAFGGQQFDPNSMAQFFQQQGGAMFNPLMFQQMMMGGGGAPGGGTGAGMGMGMGGMGGMGSGAMGGGATGMRASPAQGRGVSAEYGADRESRDRSAEPRGGRMSGSGGSPTNASLQAPTSAGLPSRPGANANSARTAGGARDYDRERSPERRSAGGGGSGSEGRW